MSDQENENVTLTKQEYKEIVDELERLALEESKDKKHDWLLFSPVFWDNFLTKILSTFGSVKMWILVFVLFAPYELLKMGLISADNFTSILTIVAPIVIGLREFAKIGMATGNTVVDKVKRFLKM
jgi:hypothetical protein